MAEIHPIRPNALAGSPLARAGASRADEAWAVAALEAPDSLIAPVWRSRNLMHTHADGSVSAALLPGGTLASAASFPWSFLGRLAEAPVFAVDLSALDTPMQDNAATFQDLRRVGGLVGAEDAAILAQARGMMHWHNRHRFCGVCGAACRAASAGHVMRCQGCGAQHFPRTDPAVIMLVTAGERALLGHPAAFRQLRVFTTLAGFVEPGESFEEAVAREVLEETGIRAARVRYHSSQPWPFPSSIMVGFYADALDEEIRAGDAELLEARWFSREELRAPEDFVLPPEFSIARRLIDDWLAA